MTATATTPRPVLYMVHEYQFYAYESQDYVFVYSSFDKEDAIKHANRYLKHRETVVINSHWDDWSIIVTEVRVGHVGAEPREIWNSATDCNYISGRQALVHLSQVTSQISDLWREDLPLGDKPRHQQTLHWLAHHSSPKRYASTCTGDVLVDSQFLQEAMEDRKGQLANELEEHLFRKYELAAA
ncbi:hypothetical protein [Aliagarivorans taiwanensis]|uniref:hypothetical protein n=1 Tax=Aliagarivorans taiwanensis TaxID=561966 RepID=UPI0003FD62B7|nr:hypothetical protein [Aliagarivorans taiwanensis]